MNRANHETWWNRPSGGREMLRLALPLIVSTTSMTVMTFTDRVFLLWHSTEAMAASMPAAMLNWNMLCFPLGIVSYINTFVAQYYGAGRLNRIGHVVWQGVWIGIAATPLFLATIPLAPWLFRWAGHPPELARLETVYYQILSLGAGASIISAALATFFTGRGANSVVMLVDTSAAALNIALDYAWIFGHWGLPAWGIEGAAWATTVAQWAKLGVYAAILLLPRYHGKYGLGAGLRFDRPLMRRLWRFGVPSALQSLIEMTAFTLFLLVVGQLGTDAQAATTLAFTINNVAWLPMWGMAVAVTTIVGQQIGRGHPNLGARATWTAFWMSQAYLSLMAMLYVLVPDWFMAAHRAGATAEEFAALRDTTVVLLRFVAAYSLLDSMNLVFLSALRGAGDTRFVLWMNLLWSPPPVLAAWLGLHYFGGGLMWCWVVLTAWVCVSALAYLARFLQGRWRHMHVIEHEVPVDEPSLVGDAPTSLPAR